MLFYMGVRWETHTDNMENFHLLEHKRNLSRNFYFSIHFLFVSVKIKFEQNISFISYMLQTISFYYLRKSHYFSPFSPLLVEHWVFTLNFFNLLFKQNFSINKSIQCQHVICCPLFSCRIFMLSRDTTFGNKGQSSRTLLIVTSLCFTDEESSYKINGEIIFSNIIKRFMVKFRNYYAPK